MHKRGSNTVATKMEDNLPEKCSKERSPFALTLAWGEMAPRNFGTIISEAEGALGGPHYGSCDYAQESIDEMINVIVQKLNTIHDQYSTTSE